MSDENTENASTESTESTVDNSCATTTSNISNGVNEVFMINNTNNTGTGKDAISDPKENTRTYIAQLYVWAFFIVIGVVFLIGLIKCFSVDEYKDMLVTVSGVLSGPLGFIVGYYFKAAQR